MTLSSASQGSSQDINKSVVTQSPLTQSRETGDAVPQQLPSSSQLKSTPAPAQKSWAHFVAGGYVVLMMIDKAFARLTLL